MVLEKDLILEKKFIFEKIPSSEFIEIELKKSDKGEKGDTGDRGQKGCRGKDGDRGQTGIKGTTTYGPQGEKGNNIKGEPGNIGPPGKIGPDGIQGVEGSQGNLGSTGIKGDNGLIGEPGTSFKIFKQFDLISELNIPVEYPDNVGQFVSVLENDGLYVYNGPNNGDTGYLNSFTYAGKLEEVDNYKGPKGEKGDIGDVGNKGIKGIIGVKGPIGSIGPIGPGGQKGLFGPTGKNGLQGIVGSKGEDANDVSGIKGDKGEEGIQGNKGEEGEKGNIGPQGIPGENGLNGNNGQKGDKGSSGQNLIIYETFSSVSSLINAPVQSNYVGQFALVNTGNPSDPDDGNLYLNVGAGNGNVGGSPNQFTFVVNIGNENNIKGEKGSVGLTGPKGMTGLIGATGIIGATGFQGNQGDQGQKGITGSTGPNGLRGSIGSNGSTGVDGEKGDIGASGFAFNIYETYSTYAELVNAPLQPNNVGEYALISTEIPNDPDDGNLYLNIGANKGDIGTGNQFEYIANIDGSQGLKGPKGEKGDIGISGSTGPKGIPGSSGIQGNTGPIGSTGATGPIGFSGEGGLKGEVGIGFIIYETFTSLDELENAPLQPNNVGEFAAIITDSPNENSDDIYLNLGANKGTIGTQNQFQYITNIEGVKGLNGNVGSTGLQGIKGNVGSIGTKGITGINGATGPIGFDGITGELGQKGDMGDIGASGIAFRIYETFASFNDLKCAPLQPEFVGEFAIISTNPPGGFNDGNLYLNIGANKGTIGTQEQFEYVANTEGTQGLKGNIGTIGITGSTGPIGNNGSSGSKGTIGATGPQGTQGLNGATGIKGIKGEIGQRFAIYDTFTNLSELEAAPLQPDNVGEFVLISTTPAGGQDDGNLYLNAGANNGTIGAQDQFQYTTNIEGSQGIIGPIGATGLTGATGIEGSKGVIGISGATGSQGPPGNKGEIGNSGVEGPKGEKGINGTKGEPGPAGKQGVQGPQGDFDEGLWSYNNTLLYYNKGSVGIGNSGASSGLTFQLGSELSYNGNAFFGNQLGIGEYDATITSNLYLNNSGDTFLSINSGNNGANIYLSSYNQTEQAFFISQYGIGLQIGINNGYIYLQDSGNMQLGPYSATPPATTLDIGSGAITLQNLYPNNNFNIFINNDSKLFISEENNKVGIGISTPETLLHVNGEINSTDIVTRNVSSFNNIQCISNNNILINFRYRYNEVTINANSSYFFNLSNILDAYQLYNNNGVQVIITAQTATSSYGNSDYGIILEVQNSVQNTNWPQDFFSGTYTYKGNKINGQNIYELPIGTDTWYIYENEYDNAVNICQNGTGCGNGSRAGYIESLPTSNYENYNNQNYAVNTTENKAFDPNQITGVLVFKTPTFQNAPGTGAWLIYLNKSLTSEPQVTNLMPDIKTNLYTDSLTLSVISSDGFNVTNNSSTNQDIIVSLSFIG